MALLLLLTCTGCEVEGRDLYVGDSILVYSAGHIAQHSFREGRVPILDIHGGTPLSEGAANATGPGWTDFWLSRALSMANGLLPVEYDCAVLSLGSNDVAPIPPENVQVLDAAYQEPFWLLPREAVRPTQRAEIQAVIPEERWIDLDYEVDALGLHPSVEGQKQIAQATVAACEGE